jgi:hypothetical protein
MKHFRIRTATVICRIILPVACLPQIASSQSGVRTVPGVIVRLDRVVDSSPSPLGLSNIFFAPPSPEIQRAMRTGEGWTGIEIADIVEGEGLRTIYAARFKLPGTDQMHYVVDTAAIWISRMASL